VWGGYLGANDHEHLLWGVAQVEQRYPKVRRIHLIIDNGASHIADDIQRYFARHPRLQVALHARPRLLA